MIDYVSASYLFDGLGTRLEEGCVIVQDGVVVGVEQRSLGSIPSAGQILRFDQACILPGFVDAHNHLGIWDSEGGDEEQMAEPDDAILARARRASEANLACGVTSLREQGERDYLDLKFKGNIEAGEWLGPRLLTAGPWITPSHGHGSYPIGADIADGVEEVRRCVRRHLKARVDWVKIMVSGGIADSGALGVSYYTPPEIRVAVEEAHNLGAHVSAHCYGGPGARSAIEAGVDSLEHVARLTDPEVLDLIAEKGANVVFTAGVIHDDARVKDSAPQALKAALAAGVNIALGADTLHGEFAFEAEIAVKYGASPIQALIAMTSGSARACRIADRVGSLEPGKIADLVVVEGDPTADVGRLRKILAVFKGGKLAVDNRMAIA